MEVSAQFPEEVLGWRCRLSSQKMFWVEASARFLEEVYWVEVLAKFPEEVSWVEMSAQFLKNMMHEFGSVNLAV